jgi:polysaccharide export outer membrane protein
LSAQPAVSGGEAERYRIGPKDLIGVTVFEVPELNQNATFRVNEDGTVQLPLLGSVKVDGLTEDEVERRFAQLLEAKYVNKATVDVEMREFRSKPISVIGAVKKPGPLAFSGRWTLLEAITESGGLAEGAGRSIFILRKAANGLTDQIAVSVDELFTRANPKANLPLMANDVINVPAVTQITVYCMGEVNSQGAIAFTSNERITLLAAIARAGGLTPRAAKRMVIKRQRQGGGEEELRVDYRDILKGRAPDLELQAGDVIVVPESFF